VLLNAQRFIYKSLAQIKSRMNRYLLILLFNCISVILFAQNEENQSLYREINEQIFDTDNFYPKNILQTNKRFEHLNGKVKTEIIIYSDSTKIVNNYNINGKLTISKVLKKEILRSTYNYEYKPDGITILRERGVNKLDYKVSYNDKYLTKYYVVQATKKKQGIFYKYLDTLFINETKYSYEFIKYINSKYSPVKVYKYKFKYNNLGYLKHMVDSTSKCNFLVYKFIK